jgi:translation initiation factor IF-1
MRMAQNSHDTKEEVIGQVTEALPNAMFRVERDDTGEEIMAFLAGKMRLYRIKVLVGDKVKMQLDPYGGKARITQRL